MPRPKKSKTALAVRAKPVTVIDPLDVPGGDDSVQFVRYLFDASPASRDQATLNALTRAKNQAGYVFEGLRGWAQKEGMAIAAQVIRQVLKGRGAMPKLSRGPIPGKVKLTKEAKHHLELLPFFNTREEANALRNILPVSYTRKWQAFFQEFGCLKCERRDVLHDSCGLCPRCRARIGAMLRRAVWIREPDGQPCPDLEEDDGIPALPAAINTPKPRRCSTCGKRFHPMSDRTWAVVRREHEHSQRHRRALKIARRGKAA